MNKILFLLIIFSFQALSKNRPYNDVVKEFVKKGCKQKKENIFLSSIDRKIIEKTSKTKLYGGLALRYITKCPNQKVLYHYVDSHIVRTLNETVVVTLSDNKIDTFEVSSFNEPPEYIAPKKWYKQFSGADGKKVLKVRDQVDGLTGATLTVNASVTATNKILAIHKLLDSKRKKI